MRSLFKVNKSERAALRRKVGEQLRVRRERDGVGIEGSSLATALPVRTLRALEAGRAGIELRVLLKVCESLELEHVGLVDQLLPRCPRREEEAPAACL